MKTSVKPLELIMEQENPEWAMKLHKRLGKWVIDITLRKYQPAIQEVHSETRYERALGVYFFLQQNPLTATKLAEQLILQRLEP